MKERQRDIFIWIVLNVSAIGWTFVFGDGKGTATFLAILISGIVGLNLVYLIALKVRNRHGGLS